MSRYTDEYSKDFKSELAEIIRNNPKVKGMVAKAIPLVLNNPYIDSKEFGIGGYLCRRKRVAARYRFIYEVDEKNKVVKFFNIRLKGKDTYRITPSYHAS